MSSRYFIFLASIFVFFAVSSNTLRLALAADITHNTDTTISSPTSGDRHIIGTNGVTLIINADTTGIANNGIKLEDISNGTVIIGSGVTVSVTSDTAIDADGTTNATITNSGTISSVGGKTIDIEAGTGASSGATVTNNLGGTITGAQNTIKTRNSTTNTTINNSGVISVTSTGRAIGPSTGNDTGTVITNNSTGIIIATSTATAVQEVIELGNSGKVTNSGQIRNDFSPTGTAILLKGNNNTVLLKDKGIVVGVIRANSGTTGNKLQLQHGFGRTYFYETEGDFDLEDLDGNTVVKGSAGSIGLGFQETADELLSQRSFTIRDAIKRFRGSPKQDHTGVIWGETFTYVLKRNETNALLKFDSHAYGLNFIHPLSPKLNLILSLEQNKLDLQGDHSVTRRGFLTGFNVPTFRDLGSKSLSAGGFMVAGVGWYDSQRKILTNTTSSGELLINSNFRSMDLIGGTQIKHRTQPNKFRTSLGEITNKWETEIGLTLDRSHTSDYNEGHLFFWEDRDLLQGSLHLEELFFAQLNERLGVTMAAELKHRKVLRGKEQTYKIRSSRVATSNGDFSENTVSGKVRIDYSAPFGVAFVNFKGQFLGKARSAIGGGIGVKMNF